MVTVGDAVWERPGVLAAVAVVHGAVVVGVLPGQVHEDVVVGADAGPAHLLAAWRQENTFFKDEAIHPKLLMI